MAKPIDRRGPLSDPERDELADSLDKARRVNRMLADLDRTAAEMAQQNPGPRR